MTVRRVATGTTDDGRSFVAHDDVVEPITVSALPGYAWHRLWGFDTAPANPAEHDVPTGLDHFPPPGGVRFTFFTVPPASTPVPPATPESTRELAERLPGRS